jgi:hypothetical protein
VLARAYAGSELAPSGDVVAGAYVVGALYLAGLRDSAAGLVDDRRRLACWFVAPK